eukprot:TRINITY_DN4180_c0_g1_i1.p1 TRINITY_DN4180_c0_g1~~TRINITY_DN4180_c0_g1_i1.p1  ORF type:complete len:637 (+),score=68.77 TRINITY_DN4180_c0_g1_i1:40-1950(+)
MKNAELGTAMFVVALVVLVAISELRGPLQQKMNGADQRVMVTEVQEILTETTVSGEESFEDFGPLSRRRPAPIRLPPNLNTTAAAAPVSGGGGGGGGHRKRIYVRKVVRVSTKNIHQLKPSARGRGLTSLFGPRTRHPPHETQQDMYNPRPADYSKAWGPPTMTPNCAPVRHVVLGSTNLTVASGSNSHFLIQLRECTGPQGGEPCKNAPGIGLLGDVKQLEGFEVYVWFYGPSMFAGEVRSHDPKQGIIKVSFRAPEPGEYTVRLVQWHTSKWKAKSKEYCLRSLSGSPMQLTITPDSGSNNSPLPWPKERCNDLVPPSEPRTGRWLRCVDVKDWYPTEYLGCPRFGWIWVPFDCYYKFISPRVLRAQQVTSWIVVFSSSLLRSLFWYFLDTMGASAYITSISWKCWGWMDLTIGNFRISWRDWRLIGFLAVPPNYEKDYLEHYTSFVKELEASPHPPDMYVFETLNITQEGPITLLRGLQKSTAHILLTNVQVGRPDRSGFEAFTLREKVSKDIAAIKKLTTASIGYLDFFTMTYPLLHDLELPLPAPAKHHQRRCGQHVCALQMDMAAQMLLNAAMSLEEKRGKALDFNASIPEKESANLCIMCPAKAFVLPFTFSPSAKLARCRDIELDPLA